MANDRLTARAEHVRRIYTGDNLAVMQGMDSESVDLIYLDPPFNSNRDYAAPITLRESEYAGQIAEFVDTWEYTDSDAEWRFVIAREEPAVDAVIEAAAQSHSYRMGGYLCMMAARILEMRRIMRPTASIYLHCDPAASHYLKAIMDAVFGQKRFRNEIVWQRTASGKSSQHAPKQYGRNSDSILFYTKSDQYELAPFGEMDDGEMARKFPKIADDGRRYALRGLYRGRTLGERPNLCYEWRGFRNRTAAGWALSKPRMDEEYQKGNVVIRADGKLERRQYAEDSKGAHLPNLWTDIPPITSAGENVGYPTQKPLALLERIIKASSKPGDVVLDPFAGCATACVAAERLDRQWIGIDVSDMAAKLVLERLQRECNDGGLPAYSERGITFHPNDVERIEILGQARRRIGVI